MDGTTHYLTTDLDLSSPDDLTALAAELESRGFVIARRLTAFADGEWYCGFALAGGAAYDEPDAQIAAMLAAVESLDRPFQSVWAGCSQRLFDIGYDCGREPFAVRQDLSTETLVRLAAVGATLRITLYSDPENRVADSGRIASG